VTLTQEERLLLQQLRLREWANERTEGGSSSHDAQVRDTEAPRPEDWSFVDDIDLHPWQRSASDAWFEAGRRGTIKVVTGAGKTIAALAIADRLHREDPELRVAVVVPTIALMQQWYDVLTKRAHIPAPMVGLLGGGHKDDFGGQRRVVIAVLASARKELPGLVRRSGVGSHLLLVVDESHRAGAPEMAAVLNTERAYSLGLSATPERGQDDVGSEETDRLSEELGEVVFEMTFADAIREGILPPFCIDHYGLPLSPVESQRYQTLTHALNDTRRELAAISPAARNAGGGEGLLAWARRVSTRSGKIGAIATRFVNDTTRRKQLLYRADSRAEAAVALVKDELARRADARVILFHESIDEVVTLFSRLEQAGLPVVMEHSGLPSDLRERSLELFRAGVAQVVVSARSLIEGFDVPEADLGVVVASSSSPRQRIQSIGRVLRKHRGPEGEEKTSRICVLYMRGTTDEAIYEKQDWDQMIGLDRNRYYHWDPPAEPVENDGPPRSAIPREDEIDLLALEVGGVYPGRYQGSEFSTDRLGNVVAADGATALNPQEIPKTVVELRGRPGRFRVTPRNGAILVRVLAREAGDWVLPRNDQLEFLEDARSTQLELRDQPPEEWVTLFGGVLDEPFVFPTSDAGDAAVDVKELSPGDTYPGPLEPATEFRFRQRAGGVIAKRVPGGEVFARGPNAERLLVVLRDRLRSGAPVSRAYINELGHAFWREDGAPRFLAALEGDLEFPEHSE
jgi:superfamily II DNA or RNA helicase